MRDRSIELSNKIIAGLGDGTLTGIGVALLIDEDVKALLKEIEELRALARPISAKEFKAVKTWLLLMTRLCEHGLRAWAETDNFSRIRKRWGGGENPPDFRGAAEMSDEFDKIRRRYFESEETPDMSKVCDDIKLLLNELSRLHSALVAVACHAAIYNWCPICERHPGDPPYNGHAIDCILSPSRFNPLPPPSRPPQLPPPPAQPARLRPRTAPEPRC